MNEPVDNMDNDSHNNYINNDNNRPTNEETPANHSVNYIDYGDPKQMQLIQKRMLEGRSFRAPSTETCPDDVYESWRTSFMNALSNDPKGIAKNFQYVWYDDEEALDNSTARFGVARDVDQVVKMIITGQIKRESIDYIGPGNVGGHPSKTAWATIATIKNADYRLVKIETTDLAGNVTSTLDPLESYKVRIFDAIAIYLTGGFYHAMYTENGVVMEGKPLSTYFEHYEEIFKALKSAHEEGVNCVPMDMIDPFKDGVYCNYSTIMKAMKRRYNRCQTHETMIDWFKKIDKIVAQKCPMEFKIQKMRTTLKKLAFNTNFPTCSDFPGDIVTQRNPDEFNCTVAFLTSFIFMDKLIPRNRWEKVQKEFYHEIEGTVTYKSWNENRLELWRKMDDEIRSKSQSNVARQINAINLDGLSVDPNDVNSCVNFVRQRQFQKRSQQQQPQKRQQISQGNRFGQNKPKTPPNRQFGQKESVPARLKRYLCRNCSSWAGTNKYHTGGFGGGPTSGCPYDRNGNKRKDKNGNPFQFIQSIEGTNVDNVPVEDYKAVFCIADDELTYCDCDHEDNDVNYAANQMLRDALNLEDEYIEPQ